jgi:Flp pilus assembly secretin CpaC
LKDKFQSAIIERKEQDFKFTKMIIKCTGLLIQQGEVPEQEVSTESADIMKIMDEKYHEIVQFFRDTDNQSKMQRAANEYQTSFAKTYYRI